MLELLILNSAGLGGLFSSPTEQDVIAECNSSTYWLDPYCWRRSRDAWAQMAALPPVPNLAKAPGAPADALTNPTGAYAPDDTVGQDLSNEAMLQTQEAIRQWGAGLPDNPIPDVPCTWMNISCKTLAIGAGIAVFALVALGGGTPRRYGR